ncbi:MAG: Mrp/NBP35 family ATP-binding protein [Acidobacteria bacterium]|nr:Mrp/NBP35 family ATP-binding protein [Acidobacteriota bacterium]
MAKKEKDSLPGKQAMPHPFDEESKERLQQRVGRIHRKLLVLSGKGGVGKSTVAANLAISLAMEGKEVGLLDIDVHGPSIPGLLGLKEGRIMEGLDGLEPVNMGGNLKVMSIGFMIQNPEDPVIWRGPMKFHLIQQFLRDVSWGDLDFLVVDSPPGTGDEPLSVAQLLGPGAEAIIVTTPQSIAVDDVRRCVTFCRKVNLAVLGVVENMSGFICPECGAEIQIFKKGGGEEMARQMDVPFLGRVPLDPTVVVDSDAGRPYVYHHAEAPAARAFAGIVSGLMVNETAADDPEK